MHTLLLADHSATIRRVVELTFADQDVRVVAVSDGHQAIERLEEAPPDILLADTAMPGRSGYELARYVKQSPRLSHIPVLLLAGPFEQIDRARAEDAGCAGFLAKPFDPQLVISRVHELLSGSFPAHPIGEEVAHPIDAAPAADSTVSPPAEMPPTDRPLSENEGRDNSEVTTRVEELDQYFDRLDRAFANRLSVPAHSGVTIEQAEDPSSPEQQGSPSAETVQSGPESGPPANSALADRFTALLAADRRDATTSGDQKAGPPSEQLIEEVTRRVLAHLSDKVVRETVAELVADIAERLVREEIERIKAAIR